MLSMTIFSLLFHVDITTKPNLKKSNDLVQLTAGTAGFLRAMKVFTETDPGFPAGSLYSTKDQPIQSFQWADYSAKPGHNYTYTITSNKGTPENLTPHAVTKINVTTESPASGNQDVYFNRGIAGSQVYVRRFGDKAPDKVPNDKAFEWLSRGLNEALEAYIRSCVPGTDALRIAAYEFSYDGFLDVVKEVLDTGVDIRIVYDARKDVPKIKNLAAVQAKELDATEVLCAIVAPTSLPWSVGVAASGSGEAHLTTCEFRS